jgi:hypothetical protein
MNWSIRPNLAIDRLFRTLRAWCCGPSACQSPQAGRRAGIALLLVTALFAVSCAAKNLNTNYTNNKYHYSLELPGTWSIQAEEGTSAEADRLSAFRVVDAPGKKALYDPKTVLHDDLINGTILVLRIQAKPNPSRLSPLDFEKKSFEEKKDTFVAAHYQAGEFKGFPAMKDTGEGMPRTFVAVGDTIFIIQPCELLGKNSDAAKPGTSERAEKTPGADKILEQAFNSIRFTGATR